MGSCNPSKLPPTQRGLWWMGSCTGWALVEGLSHSAGSGGGALTQWLLQGSCRLLQSLLQSVSKKTKALQNKRPNVVRITPCLFFLFFGGSPVLFSPTHLCIPLKLTMTRKKASTLPLPLFCEHTPCFFWEHTRAFFFSIPVLFSSTPVLFFQHTCATLCYPV